MHTFIHLLAEWKPSLTLSQNSAILTSQTSVWFQSPPDGRDRSHRTVGGKAKGKVEPHRLGI